MNISKSDCMIRIKVSSREQSRDNVQKSPREAFWNLLRTEKGYSEESIASLEAQVFRKFGDKLRSKMVENIQQSLHDVEEAAYGRNLSNMVDELRHSLHFRHFKEMEWPYFSFEPFGRLVEFRQQFLQDLPVVRDSLERLSYLSQVRFTTTIQGYGSLELGILPTSIENLAKAFYGEFETFQFLLDVFVPQVFGEVFTREFADAMAYQITIPLGFREAFTEQMSTKANVPVTVATSKTSETTAPQADSRQRDIARKAEWVWRLANGSLIFPVILALIVLYFGVKELTAFRNAQYEALKPILEHHMLLLKEDRERMFPKQDTTNMFMQKQITAEQSKPDDDTQQNKKR